MAKMIFFILLAVNIALFGMVKGLWGPGASEVHEPKRILAQINPDQLQIVSTLQPDTDNAPADDSSSKRAEDVYKAIASPVNSGTVQESPLPSTSAAPAVTQDDAPFVTPAVPIPAETPATPAPQVQAVPPTSAPQQNQNVNPPVSQPAAKAPVKTPVSDNVSALTAPAKTNNLACLEAGYFVLPDARKFETQINNIPLGMKEVRKSVEEVVSYMVRIPANNGQAGANRRAAELQKAGVNDFYIVPGTYAIDNLRWSVSLGVFRTENAAKSFMHDLTAKGIKQMVITPRKATSSKIAYQFKNVTPAQRSLIEKVMLNYSAQDLHHC